MMITYLRAGRQLRATGREVETRNGLTKVKPVREDWGHVWISKEEIEAGAQKGPVTPRSKPVAPPEGKKRANVPKPPPVARWRVLVEKVRIAQTYGDQFVPISLAAELAAELEAAQTLFKS